MADQPNHLLDDIASVNQEDQGYRITTRSGHEILVPLAAYRDVGNLPPEPVSLFLDLREWDENDPNRHGFAIIYYDRVRIFSSFGFGAGGCQIKFKIPP